MNTWTLRPEGCEGYGAGAKHYEYTKEDECGLAALALDALCVVRIMADYIANSYDAGEDHLGLPVAGFNVLETLLEPINEFYQRGGVRAAAKEGGCR
jgi:hypothetical protein